MRPLGLLFGISGFLCVLLGAFGAHGLESTLSNSAMEAWQTAVNYHFYHTLATGLCILFYEQKQEKWSRRAGWAFVSGIVLFSGSLYLLSLTTISWFGFITPIGGLVFLLGWLMLGCRFISSART